ncbi:sensor histidine kinase [Paenibacillus aurantius]|uniref:Sensor histidine kinase n=1 Tax=Paenibacillus aurantius TaxID=2918900 RepID=A0AA96LBR1_9BACL|nr:sensor histidine kinase [Paenibacillus aurantius]WNQ10159.1 sensor histidine kinase [Paenibacillus aurantius]
MWRWLAGSLRRRLSFLLLVSILIPLLFLGGFSYVTSSRAAEAKTKQAGIDTLHQMEAKLKFILSDVENMSLFMIGQRDIQQYLAKPGEDPVERDRVLGLMTNLAGYKDYLTAITLYPSGTKAPLSTATIYESDLTRIADIQRLTGKRWTDPYRIVNYSGSHTVLSFIRPMRGIGTYTDLGSISITLNEQALIRLWNEPQLGDGQGSVMLVNDKGLVVSAADESRVSHPLDALFPGLSSSLTGKVSGAVTYGSGPDKKTVLYYKEPMVGWTLVGLIPYELYSASSRYIVTLTAAAVALAVIAAAGLVLFLVRRVTNPLQTLTRLLSKVDPNEPLPRYPAGSPDEIGRLAESYNRLGRHIEMLKKELIRNETRKKEADLRALQAQINPHFLYNTLSSIHWIALMNEEKRIADMVGALSDFLRFSLNKGKDYCPVHQEIAHIRNYAQVQSIRFPDKFTVDCSVDPDLTEKIMLKLLLQPLVENAMLHGVQRKEGRGTITVMVERKQSRMAFLVLDDGVGMSEEQVSSLRARLEQAGSPEGYPEEELPLSLEGSYGLRNVHERLLLHYGPEAGLKIESRPGAGTRVAFSIPIREEVRHENHDRG